MLALGKIVVDHSSWWHSVNSPSPQSTFHLPIINFCLRENIYHCQKPSSLFEVLQSHSYHISRDWREGQKEVGGIIWQVAFLIISFYSPLTWLCTWFTSILLGLWIWKPHSGPLLSSHKHLHLPVAISLPSASLISGITDHCLWVIDGSSSGPRNWLCVLLARVLWYFSCKIHAFRVGQYFRVYFFKFCRNSLCYISKR